MIACLKTQAVTMPMMLFYITAVTLVTTQSLVPVVNTLWNILKDSVHASVQSQLSAKLWFHAAFKPSGKQSTRVYHFTKALKDVTSLKQNILSHHHTIVRL